LPLTRDQGSFIECRPAGVSSDGGNNVKNPQLACSDLHQDIPNDIYAQQGSSAVSALTVHDVMAGAIDQEHATRLNTLNLVVPNRQPVL